MTNTRGTRITPALLMAAGCLLVGSTGGAVAGGMVTGAQIKNNSVSGKDIKDRSIQSKDINATTLGSLEGPAGAPGAPGPPGKNGTNGTNGVSEYEIWATSESVPANTPWDLTQLCPEGKSVLGAAGWWNDSHEAVQTTLLPDGTGAEAYTDGVPAADALILRITCASLGAATMRQGEELGKLAR